MAARGAAGGSTAAGYQTHIPHPSSRVRPLRTALQAPPKFADITKATKDLFSDDFNAGKVQLTLKSKATNGVNLKVKGTKSNAKGNVSGSLESTYTNAGGISFKEVWSTQNEVTTEVSMKNALVKGTKLVGEAKFSPTAGFKGQTIKCDYGKDCDSPQPEQPELARRTPIPSLCAG